MIFLDSGFLCAYFSEEDAHHERVSRVLDSHQGQRLADYVLTTNHVVAETITLIRVRSHRDPRVRHQLAVKVGRELFAGTFGEIHQATAEEERAAFEYLERHPDQSYSFVDCLSFVVMEKLGIETAWTVDRHFTHHFIAIPGPLPRQSTYNSPCGPAFP